MEWLRKGAKANGFTDGRWTCLRIVERIERDYSVRYHTARRFDHRLPFETQGRDPGLDPSALAHARRHPSTRLKFTALRRVLNVPNRRFDPVITMQ